MSCSDNNNMESDDEKQVTHSFPSAKTWEKFFLRDFQREGTGVPVLPALLCLTSPVNSWRPVIGIFFIFLKPKSGFLRLNNICKYRRRCARIRLNNFNGGSGVALC